LLGIAWADLTADEARRIAINVAKKISREADRRHRRQPPAGYPRGPEKACEGR
jgi:hypothetical protein